MFESLVSFDIERVTFLLVFMVERFELTFLRSNITYVLDPITVPRNDANVPERSSSRDRFDLSVTVLSLKYLCSSVGVKSFRSCVGLLHRSMACLEEVFENIN